MKRTLLAALSPAVALALLLSTGIFSSAAQPAPPPTLELVGQIGGAANGVAVQGAYAYVAGGASGLRIVNVADPAHPVEVGSLPTVAPANAIAVAGGAAYVAAGFAGLRIVDVADPAHPVEAGFFQTPAGEGQ